MDKSKSIRIGLLHRASLRRCEPGGVLAWRVHKFLHAGQDETLDEWQMALDAHGWVDDHGAVCRHDDGDLDRIYRTRFLVNDRESDFLGLLV